MLAYMLAAMHICVRSKICVPFPKGRVPGMAYRAPPRVGSQFSGSNERPPPRKTCAVYIKFYYILDNFGHTWGTPHNMSLTILSLTYEPDTKMLHI